MLDMYYPLIAVLSVMADDESVRVARPACADDVVASMIAHDHERQAAFHGYTAMRRYILEVPSRHKRAEMVVRVISPPDNSKQFEIVSASGWDSALKHVFPRLLEAETEAARPGVRDRSRIIPQNYSFEMIGMETIRNRLAYVLAIEPKTQNKYLSRGKIWVDADEFVIVRVEGQPAKSPSIWFKSVHFSHDYEKSGPFWFPAVDRSVTNVRMLGASEMTIECFDYRPNEPPDSEHR
jgi:hypothetical protein